MKKMWVDVIISVRPRGLPFSGQDQLPAQTCRFQTASGDTIWACREAQSQVFWHLKLTTAHTTYIHRIYQYCCGQSSVSKTGYHFPLPVILFHFKCYPDRSLFCTIKNKVKRFRTHLFSTYFNIFVFSFPFKKEGHSNIIMKELAVTTSYTLLFSVSKCLHLILVSFHSTSCVYSLKTIGVKSRLTPLDFWYK